MYEANKSKPWNFIDVTTLLLALLVAASQVGYWVEFGWRKSKLAEETSAEDLDFKSEPVIQLTAEIRTIGMQPVSIVPVVVQAQNVRRQEEEIQAMEIEVTPIQLDEVMVSRIRKNVAANSWMYPPDREDSKESNAENAKEIVPRVSIIRSSEDNRLDLLSVEQERVTRVKFPESGGVLQGGQTRQTTFDLLIEDGNTPRLFLVSVFCYVNGEQKPLVYKSWLGLGGFPAPSTGKGYFETKKKLEG